MTHKVDSKNMELPLLSKVSKEADAAILGQGRMSVKSKYFDFSTLNCISFGWVTAIVKVIFC